MEIQYFVPKDVRIEKIIKKEMRRALILAIVLSFYGLAAAQTPVQEKAEMAPVTDVADDGHIFIEVEEDPEFPGGMDSLYSFLARNLKWPCKNDCDCFGRVFVTFIVEEDGSLTNGEILRDLCPGCCAFGEEALRVVSLMPKWKPGRVNGKPVRVRFNLPINFTLR